MEIPKPNRNAPKQAFSSLNSCAELTRPILHPINAPNPIKDGIIIQSGMTKDTNPEALMIELKKKGPVSQPAGIFNFIEIHPHKVEMAKSNTSIEGSVMGLLSKDG